MSEKLSDTDGYAGNNDLNPNYNWDRAIPAPGHSGVDFEKRVDFDRLHKYRLARAKEALFTSELGALMCFDNNNIRLFLFYKYCSILYCKINIVKQVIL